MSSPYLIDIRQTALCASDAARAASDAAMAEVHHDKLSDQLVLFGLVREIADVLNAPRPLVFSVIWNAPVEMAGLTETPHGWTAWTLYVAGELGISPPYFLPTVH